jgi:anti-sigma factor RsiW
VQDLLPEHAAGALDTGRRGLVDEHLATCAECRAESEIVARVRASSLAVPGALEGRVVAAVRRGPLTRRWGAPGQLAAAATLAAAVIGGALYFDGGRNGPIASSDTTAPGVSESSVMPGVERPPLVGGSVLGDLTDAELQVLLDRMES